MIFDLWISGDLYRIVLVNLQENRYNDNQIRGG